MIDHAKMREKILNAGIDAVCEYGIEKCTSRHVALLAEKNEACIFRYFAELTELRARAYTVIMEQMALEIAATLSCIPRPGSEDAEGAVKLAVARSAKENTKRIVYCTRYIVSSEYTEDIHSDATEIFETQLNNIERKKQAGNGISAKEVYTELLGEIVKAYLRLGPYSEKIKENICGGGYGE